MPGPGRNQPCACGSGRKTKHCCGQRRGPSDDQIARAHLAALRYHAVEEIGDLSDDSLEVLWSNLFDLPRIDLSLHVTLPQLISPELECLREAIADDDPDSGWDELAAVSDEVDTPQQRARLADAIIALRDRGRIGHTQAAAAIFDLSGRSQELITASVIHAVSVAVGVEETPGGLRLIA